MTPADFNKLKAKFPAISETPYVYLEASVHPDTSNSYFRLLPQYLYFGKSEGLGFGSSKRDLVFAFSFKRPDATPDRSVFASTTLSFFGLNPSIGVAYLTPDGPSSDWMPMPAPDDNMKKELDQIKQKKADEKQKQDVAEAATKKLAGLKKVFCSNYRQPLDEYKNAMKELCTLVAKGGKNLSDCPETILFATSRAEFEKAKDLAQSELQDAGEITNAPGYCNPPGAVATAPVAVRGMPPDRGAANSARGAFTVEVSLTETRKGSAFLKALGQVFDGAKGDISNALKTELIPSQKAAAQKQESDASLKAAADSDALVVLALQAQQKVAEAEDNLANPSAGATPAQLQKLQLAVQIAKINANTAFRNAGKSLPYPEAGSGL